MNIRKQRKKANRRIARWLRVSDGRLADPTGHQFDLWHEWEWRRGWRKRQGRFSS